MIRLTSSLWQRFRAHLGLKLLLLLILPTATTAMYLITQRLILFPNRIIPHTWIDSAIPFRPRWVWAYLSLYLLMPIGPLLTRSKEMLLAYTRGVLLYFGVGLVCFVLFPIAGPRPQLAPKIWLYEQLIQFDKVYNSLPSLHAACAVFAVIYSSYASQDVTRRGLRRWLLAVGWIWVALILYSTVATRQHFALDLPPGIVLGAVAAKLCCGGKRFKKVDRASNRVSMEAIMKLLVSVTLLFFLPLQALAQTADHPEDREVLRHLKDEYEKAVNEGNADLIAPYVADDFTGVVPTNEQISGLSGLKDYWKRIQALLGPGGKVKTSVSFEPSLIAGDFALSHGRTDNSATTSAGKTYHYTTFWTALSRKSGQDWKLIRIHDSMDPINNEFVETFSQYRLFKWATISGIAALLVGILIGRITKRRAPAGA